MKSIICEHQCWGQDDASAVNVAIGRPRMLGSVDCMYWRWKNRLAAWHNQLTGHCHDRTIILKGVASEILWICPFYFGLPESHNDINMLHRSHPFARLVYSSSPPCNFTGNGNQYGKGYYLTDASTHLGQHFGRRFIIPRPKTLSISQRHKKQWGNTFARSAIV